MKQNETNLQKQKPKASSETVAPVQKAEVFDTLEKNLNSLLANEYTLFTKTLKYHWNVTGPRFYSIHEFLEGHYKILLSAIDDLAERIREIKSHPIGTMMEFSERNSIVEHPGANPEASMMLVDLLKDHQTVQEQIQKILKHKKDLGMRPSSEDFLVGLLKQHEEMAWMLRSTLN